MHNLIRTIAAKLNATETETSQVMQDIRAELADFVAKLKQETDIALTKTREVFEEAAGRGFPDHDFTAQSAKLREAQAEVSKADELGAAVANIVEPAPVAPVEPVLETKTYSDGTVATGTAPLPEQSPVEPVEPAPVKAPKSTKTK